MVSIIDFFYEEEPEIDSTLKEFPDIEDSLEESPDDIPRKDRPSIYQKENWYDTFPRY